MLTFTAIQIFFSAVGSTLGTLYKYHYFNLAAQIFMVVFNIMPLSIVRLLAIAFLGCASISSVFSWFLSFVRFWRYLFFPTRQNFVFFGECILNFLIVTPQIVFYMYQARQLAYPKTGSADVKYKHIIYKYAVTILFFHDFFYAAVLFNIGTWYEFFGFSQFVVHALMMFLPEPDDENNVAFKGFVAVWFLLLLQHILTVIFTFTDPALSEAVLFDSTRLDFVVWWLASVYILVDIVYLLNASVFFDFVPCKSLRPYIDDTVNKLDSKLSGRAGESSRSLEPKSQKQL